MPRIYTRRENPLVECKCGCGEQLLKYGGKDGYGCIRYYITGHSHRKESSKDGEYEYVFAPNHPNKNHRGKVYRHRLVMEAHIGRYLTKDEIVHHKDEDPHNNDISNLEIMSRPKHKQHHWAKDFTNVLCILCNSKTYTNPTTGKQHWTKHEDGYLCMKCYKKMKKLGLK
jgi:hypothetical protein